MNEKEEIVATIVETEVEEISKEEVVAQISEEEVVAINFSQGRGKNFRSPSQGRG